MGEGEVQYRGSRNVEGTAKTGYRKKKTLVLLAQGAQGQRDDSIRQRKLLALNSTVQTTSGWLYEHHIPAALNPTVQTISD